MFSRKSNKPAFDLDHELLVILDRAREAGLSSRSISSTFQCSQPQMDCRLHLRLDRGRLVLRGRRHRSVLSPRGWLVDERSNDSSARHRCPGDGDLAAWQARRTAASLRSRHPVHQRAVPATDGRSRRRLLDEPFRQCLGHCSSGNVWDNAAMESFFASGCRPPLRRAGVRLCALRAAIIHV